MLVSDSYSPMDVLDMSLDSAIPMKMAEIDGTLSSQHAAMVRKQLLLLPCYEQGYVDDVHGVVVASHADCPELVLQL